MPQEHFVMTIQSIWNRVPQAAATTSGLIETDGMTAEEVYEQVHQRAVETWHEQYQRTDLGEVAVLLYNREVNEG